MRGIKKARSSENDRAGLIRVGSLGAPGGTKQIRDGSYRHQSFARSFSHPLIISTSSCLENLDVSMTIRVPLIVIS